MYRHTHPPAFCTTELALTHHLVHLHCDLHLVVTVLHGLLEELLDLVQSLLPLLLAQVPYPPAILTGACLNLTTEVCGTCECTYIHVKSRVCKLLKAGEHIKLTSQMSKILHCSSVWIDNNTLQHWINNNTFAFVLRFGLTIIHCTRKQKSGEKGGRPGRIHHVNDVRWMWGRLIVNLACP